MRGLFLGAFSVVLVCGLLCSCPATALVGPEPGVSRSAGAPLGDCQKRFTEALRFMDREREYSAEKERYHRATAKRCSEERWYDLGFPECVLLVPLFGLILPFFGLMIIGTVRSVRRTSSARSTE
jgi:hypothetical protein